MRLTTLILILSLFANQIFAADDGLNPDSLLRNRARMADSTLLIHYKTIHNHFINYSPDSAIFYNHQAIEYFEKKDNIRILITLYENLTAGYIRIGDYGKAQIYANKGLKLAEETNNIVAQANLGNSLGIIFATNKDFDKAREYYSKAIELNKQMNNWIRVAIILTNLTGIYLEEGDTEEAKNCSVQALDIYVENSDSMLQSVALNNLGEVYLSMNKVDSAMIYLAKAKDLKNLLGLRSRLPVTLNLLAEANMKRKFYDSTYYYYHTAYQIADSLGMPTERLSTLEGLSEFYKETGNNKLALKYLELYTHFKDSLFNVQKDRQLKELEIRYQVDKKDTEIELLNSKVVLQRRLRNLGILLLILAGALFIVTYNRIRLKSLLLEKENDLEKERSRQLKYELEENNRKLMAQSMLSIQKNQLLNEIKDKLTTIEGPCENINQAVKLVEETHSADREWENLKIHFEKVHPDFFINLQQQCPELTSTDLRHCAYIRIQMSSKDVARIMNVDPKSVKMTRYRLKKKLSLGEDDSLEAFLLNL